MLAISGKSHICNKKVKSISLIGTVGGLKRGKALGSPSKHHLLWVFPEKLSRVLYIESPQALLGN